MAESGKLVYTLDTFPYDKLRVGRKSWGVGFSSNASFGKTHAYTLVETAPGKYETYDIQLSILQAESLTYYLAEGAPNKPSLYMHITLYPKWPIKTPAGDALYDFGIKFREACLVQLEAMSDEDKLALMGTIVMSNIRLYVDEFFSWSTYSDKHPKAGLPNKEKSQQMKAAVWTQDVSDIKDEKKRAFYGSEKGRKTQLFIPGTERMIYTKFFWKDEPRHVAEYARLKQFFFKRNHENTNEDNTKYSILAKNRIMAPSLVFNPKKNERGGFQIKLAETKFTNWTPLNRDSVQSEERIAQDKREAEEAMAEFGFTVQEEEQPQQQHFEEKSEPNKRFRNADGSAFSLNGGGSGEDGEKEGGEHDREYDEESYETLRREAGNYF